MRNGLALAYQSKPVEKFQVDATLAQRLAAANPQLDVKLATACQVEGRKSMPNLFACAGKSGNSLDV